MDEKTKYEELVNFFLDNWIISVIILIAVIIAFIPSLRDGIFQILKLVKLIFKKRNKDFSIELQGERITIEQKSKSALFDIVKINATTHHLGILAENLWIKKHYPNHDKNGQSLSKVEVDEKDSLYFDKIFISNKKGQKKTIYFDISAFFNDGGHTSVDMDRFAKTMIKELYKKE